MGSSRRVGEKKGKLNDMCRGVGYGVFLLFNDFMVFLTNPRFFQFNKQIIDFLFLLVRFLLHEPPSFFVCESNGFFKVLWIEFFDEDIRSHGSSKLVVVYLHVVYCGVIHFWFIYLYIFHENKRCCCKIR